MAKIKTKTHSGAKKRFKMTASGKVKYQKTNKRHRLTEGYQAQENCTYCWYRRQLQCTGTEKADAVSVRLVGFRKNGGKELWHVLKVQ